MAKFLSWLFSFMLFAVSVAAAGIELDVQFDPDEHVVFGSMYVAWDSPPQTATFALLANLGRERNPYVPQRLIDQTYVNGFDPAWTKIDKVVWLPQGGGEKEVSYRLLPAPPVLQKYSLKDVLLEVKLPPGAGAGKLRMDFRTRFPDLLSGEPGRLGKIYTWRFGWHPIPVSPPRDDSWPFVLPACNYSLELKLPPGWTAVLPGQAAKADGGNVYRTSFPRPVRSISLYIAPEDAIGEVDLNVAGVTLTAAYLPGDEDKMRSLLTYIPEILADYAERFGPYPYQRLVFIEQPTELGIAMAADGVIYFPKWFFDRFNLTAEGILSRYGQFILAHELAHQWWGVGVGVDLDAENWLSEGLAQYSAISWYEKKFGAQGGNVFKLAQKGLGESWAESLIGFANLREHFTELPYLRTAFDGFDEALVKPAREVKYAQVTGERLYDKGYLVFRALAHLVGEKDFDTVLHALADKYRSSVLTVSELKGALESQLGKDLSSFFRDWVWGDAQADYMVEKAVRQKRGDRYLTLVYLRRRGSGFLPVEVAARGEKESEELVKTWLPTDKDAEVLQYETDFPVRQVVVDPGHYVLDTDRLNNVWPRKFVIAATRNELPLDGYLVRVDPESRALSVQYLDRFGWAAYPNEMAVAGFVRYGRDLTLRGFAQVKGTLLGSFAVIRRLWAQPELGDVGTYWVPAGELTLSFSRRPYPLLGVGLTWNSVAPQIFGIGLSLLAVPPSQGRLYLKVGYELGLLPNTYLDITLGAGGASAGIPQALSFSLPEFHSLRNGALGARKLFFGAQLWLPPYREPYDLAGLALISRVTPQAYLSWGRLWNDAGEVTHVELGAELHLQVEMLGGVMSFDLVLGGAWPLPEGEGTIYFEVTADQG